MKRVVRKSDQTKLQQDIWQILRLISQLAMISQSLNTNSMKVQIDMSLRLSNEVLKTTVLMPSVHIKPVILVQS